VPPNDGLGPYDGNSVNDTWTQSIEPYEDQPVDDPEPRPEWRLPVQDHQLMAKHKNLHFKPSPRFERRGEDTGNQLDDVDHASSI
jgi:hypothetical protein